MNLRKALDRAEKEREPKGDVGDAIAAKDAPTDGSEWQSPVYSESRTVTIDIPTAVKNHCVALSSDFVEIDYYKVLRTQLRHLGRQKEWNTVMVTSATPAEGKTVTAVNLAATFAREYNQTVLLVDADLRMQMIHRYLGYNSRLGLLDYLEEKAAMKDVITWPGIEKFTIISGERVVEESSELIGSPRMQSLMADLKHRYEDRFIIFDAPPILGVADALAFAPLVDCIVIVVGAGVTRRQDLKQALELLPQEKIAGFVLNRFKGPNRLYDKYGYRYGYKRTGG
jgi:non-specific protein-tyrosine kinase